MESAQMTAGALLALLLRRRGWSAPRLAEIAGSVSASSVRAYLTDRTIPRPGQALALANALGPQDGRSILEAWGYTDLADGFVEQWRQAMIGDDAGFTTVAQEYFRYNRVEYAGEPLSEPGQGLLRAMVAWVQYIEQGAPGAAGNGKARRRSRPGPAQDA